MTSTFTTLQTNTTDGPNASSPVIMRSLISTQDAAVIIGKHGHNVNEIRENSGARVSISDPVPRTPERILLVSGPLDAVSKAFGLIVRRINGESFDNPSSTEANSVTIRLLIPHSRMGSVVGKGGARIREIQEQSGAKLQASENVLPNCTERILQVIGVADAIHIAIYYIGLALLENKNQITNHVPYRPKAQHNRTSAHYANAYREANARLASKAGSIDENIEKDLIASGLDPEAVKAAFITDLPRGVEPSRAKTQNLFIPLEYIGALIGKRGFRINEIRGSTNTTISISKAGQSGAQPHERLVSITGDSTGIQKAINRISALLETEKSKQNAALH